MNESNIKNELLKQDGTQATESDVAQLRKMVEAEDRRARRLGRWAVVVWALFFLLLAAGLGIPMILYQLSRAAGHAQAQVATAPVAAPAAHHAPGIFAAIAGTIMVAGFFSLPIVGVTLTIMAFAARRTVGRKQIMTALASIDLHLRQLTSSQARSSEG